MKKVLSVLSILLISMAMVFTSCNKDNKDSIKEDLSYEIDLKSYEPDVTIKGGGDKTHYTKVVIEKVVHNVNCKKEPVSGIVQFYYEEEMVFSVDFGDGECDGVATVTWIKEDGSTNSRVVDVWKLFKKPNGEQHIDKCFKIILPVSFNMPDGTTFTVDTKEDWRELKAWHDANPGYDEKPVMQFPVEIQYKDSTIVIVNTNEELRAYRKECGGHHHHKLSKVITEELVRSEECDGEVVAGLVEFYDKDNNWVYSIDFGSGECDGIATKCWLNDAEEIDCKDIDITNTQHWN